MNDTAISLKNISKKYKLYDANLHRLKETFHPFKKKYHKEFWALKNVSFDIKKGETVGIIGRNGSGKSTLLQIISGVLNHSEGDVEVNGRISALLELGTGFNHQLTGRENVFINGAILGYSRKEMEERMPNIEAFADIGEFIDQPVKIYSSGMFVRLAFAAAINVDPDILIVDEALAVGDAKFQNKCFNKFLEFQKLGKTIIFVTHSTDAVVRHCDYAILLESGEILEKGEPKEVMNYYLDILFSGTLNNYASKPVIVEADYHNFSIVHYKKKYYAYATKLGTLDVSNLLDDKMSLWQSKNDFFIRASLEELKLAIDEIHLGKNRSNYDKKDITLSSNKELENFLKSESLIDNAINRRTYNKNEYRYGSRKVEIIDYLIVNDNDLDLVNIDAGGVVDIFVKIKFNKQIVEPMTGFAIKTVDGVDVFGTSTMNMEIKLDMPATIPSIMLVKWTVDMHLKNGDYFLDVGCAEYLNGESKPLDRRYSLAHFMIHSTDMFAGFVNIKPRFEKII